MYLRIRTHTKDNFVQTFMKNKLFIFIPVILIVVGIPITAILLSKERANNIKSSETQEIEDPEGTIYVEAGEGILTAGGSFSYIAESARGLEAYLAEKGASAIYSVTSSKSGTYILMVKVSDDGLYEDGTRDATVVINGSKTLLYKHVSEDTKGWKWYTVGVTPILQGANSFVFTKNEDTAGAFVMDEFKLLPTDVL